MDPFVGEIKLVGFNFAPEGWLPCDGRIVQITSYQTLFALLGAQFGGDGAKTFGLPDLRGSVAVGMGQGTYPGATNYVIGAKGGTEQVTLAPSQSSLAAHTHSATVTDPVFTATANITPGANDGARGVVTSNTPVGNYPTLLPTGTNNYATTADAKMGATSTSVTVTKSSPGSVAVGPNAPTTAAQHENRMPFQAANYIIAYNGVFPTRP